jgi:hypothetical protein
LWVDSAPQECKYHVLALDPSKGRHSKVGDYSAFVQLRVSDDGTIYVNSWLMRMALDQLQAFAVQLLARLRPQGFIYEKIFEQRAVGQAIQDACQLQGVPCPMYEYVPRSNMEKNEKIRLYLTPLLGQRKIKLVRDATASNQLLLAQLKEFPCGMHDDAPDALCQALYLLEQIKHGPRQAPTPLTLSV